MKKCHLNLKCIAMVPCPLLGKVEIKVAKNNTILTHISQNNLHHIAPAGLIVLAKVGSRILH